MSTMAVVLLGLISLGSLVQTIFLLGTLRSGLLVLRRARQIQRTWDDRLRPALAEVERVQRSVAELSELMSRQAERLEEFSVATAEKVESARRVVAPLSRVLTVVAAFRAARKGFSLFRRFRRA